MTQNLNKGLISVIIPVYNTAPYLRKCLDSVCEQTYKNLEIICVDDGSTDDSLSILREYAARDERIRVLVQANSGLAAARNTGLAAAHGEWVTGVDSDDWLEPDTYGRSVPHLTDDVDLLCFNSIIDGNIEAAERHSLESYGKIYRERKAKLTPEITITLNVYFWNKLFRRSVVESAKIRFSHGKLYEDAPFLYCFACMANQVYMMPDMLYHYVQRNDSIMGQSAKKTPRALDHLEVARYTYDFYKRHGKTKAWQTALLRLFDVAYRQTKRFLPETMLETFQKEARELVHHMELTDCRHSSAFQAMRKERMGRAESLFHKIYGDRDSYGFMGLHLWTVVHKPQSEVYYCCGHRLFERQHCTK